MKNYLPVWLLAALMLLAACGADSHQKDNSFQLPDIPVIIPAPEPAEEPPVLPPEEALPAEELPPEEPPAPWEWERDLPDNQGLDGGRLEAVHDDYDSFPLLAAVIVKNGYIVDEYYKEGFDSESLFVLNSASKSITSALVGIAIEEGYLESVDVPLSDYFPEILEKDSPYWGQITLWHLLTHTSGIASTDSERWYQWRASENWVEYILDLPMEAQPGTLFHYSTGNTHLLTAVLERAAGMTACEFGKRCLFDPLDMDSAACGADPQGVSDGGNGFCLNIYDMAKLGWLYLNNGSWEGTQIVPEQWVADSTRVQYKRSSGSADYGYQWWVRTFGQRRYDAFFAQGHGGQYIFVVPQLELVVAFTSNYTGATSVYWQLVNDIVAACEGPEAAVPD